MSDLQASRPPETGLNVAATSTTGAHGRRGRLRLHGAAPLGHHVAAHSLQVRRERRGGPPVAQVRAHPV